MAYDEQALKPADKRRSLGVTSFFLCDFYPPFIPHPRVTVQTVALTGRMWTDETARTERGGRDGADRTGRTWKKVFDGLDGTDRPLIPSFSNSKTFLNLKGEVLEPSLSNSKTFLN